MELQKIIFYERSEIWLENHIIHYQINQPVIDAPLLEALDKARTQLCQERAYLDFHDMRQVKYATKSARDYYADPKKTKFVKAGAIWINFRVVETIANYYLKFHAPPVPTRFFYSQTEALAWLLTYQ
jgi:hypothetical protein